MLDAELVLDQYIFGNLANAGNNIAHIDDKWAVTYEDDNFVVWDIENDELTHFRVVIEEYEWDSTQAREDQEWDI